MYGSMTTFGNHFIFDYLVQSFVEVSDIIDN